MPHAYARGVEAENGGQIGRAQFESVHAGQLCALTQKAHALNTPRTPDMFDILARPRGTTVRAHTKGSRPD